MHGTCGSSPLASSTVWAIAGVRTATLGRKFPVNSIHRRFDRDSWTQLFDGEMIQRGELSGKVGVGVLKIRYPVAAHHSGRWPSLG